jgi:protein O-GlcNAc transferase
MIRWLTRVLATYRSIETAERPAAADTLDACVQLGWECLRRNDLPGAIDHNRRALALDARSAEALNNLSIALMLDGRREEALEACRRLVEVRPDAGSRLNLASACRMLGRLDEAAAEYRLAAQLDPASADAHANLGVVLMEMGQHAEAEAALRRALALSPGSAKLHSNLLLSLNYRDDVGPERVFEEHRAWARLHAAPLEAAAAPHANERSPGRRLRIGYVSGDFKRHSVAWFAEPVLAAHDRERFAVVCYSDVPKPDAVTARIRACADEWREIFGRSDEEVAARVRADAIDILVDLGGHTGKHRLLVFARRPAPVQVTWLGYPNTTGLRSMDYRITDIDADPPGLADALHTEKLLRLADGFLCYAPPASSPPVGPVPFSSSGRITFGCFNNLAKLTPAAVALWSRLLAAVPGSRLVLKARGMASEATREDVRRQFHAQGIGEAALALREPLASLESHLAAYGEIDIALDVFPYNGTTTTCEALWMGVPVVALAGRVHASRVGASILRRVGLHELVAHDEGDYLRIGRSLAADPVRMQALRAGMRQRLAASPLLDANGFVRGLEGAFREAWRRRWSAE